MSFEDRRLRCVKCGVEFVWKAGEQAFFADRHLDHAPKHCRRCKSNLATGRVGVLDSSRRAVEAQATCSACGRSTTVPFRPAPGRPVFCRDCYHHRKTLGAGRA